MVQVIPLPQTGNTLNPDGTINPGGQPLAGGGTPVPVVPSNPPFVPPTETPPITITKPTVPPPLPPPSTNTPSIVLTQPYIDPPGTTRIYKTEDAYQIFPENLDSYIYTYAIGTDASPTRASFIVKNLCTQNTIGITLNLPQFLDTSIETAFLLAPLASQIIELIVSETGSINLIEQRKTTYAEPLIISVEVLNVTGPVYIQTPGFVPPVSPSTKQETVTISGSEPVVIPSGLPPAKRNLLLSQSIDMASAILS